MSGKAEPAISVDLESPRGSDLTLLFDRHCADMHSDTPPESIHMIPREALEGEDLQFFVLRVDGRAAAMGALKRLDADHGELKSMHVLTEFRGRGLSRRMLASLVESARTQGMRRLSLETGVQPTFEAARALYRRAGFHDCPPFGSYRDDPNSVFMTRDV